MLSSREAFSSQLWDYWRWTPRSSLCFWKLLVSKLLKLSPIIWIELYWDLGLSSDLCLPLGLFSTFSQEWECFQVTFFKNENACFCSCSRPLAIAKRPNSLRAPFTPFALEWDSHSPLTSWLNVRGPGGSCGIGTEEGFLVTFRPGQAQAHWTERKEIPLSVSRVQSASAHIPSWNECLLLYLNSQVPWQCWQNLCFYSVRCSG